MTIQQIYALALSLGIANDLRPKAQVMRYLARQKKKYEKLSPAEKKFFDTERLTNPYPDTCVHYDNGVKSVKRVMAGIDIDTAELALARTISDQSRKKPIDLVIAHHPVGKGLTGLDAVMDLQVDVLAQYGVPITIAEKILHKRIAEVSRGVDPVNHFKAVDAARLLNMNYMCTHTIADNMVATFLKKKIEKDQPEYVGDVIASLMEIPEYQESKRQGAGPRLFAGADENRAGRIAVTEITGGTEGSPEIYERMAQAGVGTVIAMHQSEEHRKQAEKAHINVVIAGHMSSDSIGMNLFLDELEKRGVDIVPCSGLIRHSRVKKK